ncbi:MAG: sulfatase [Verrucomicrobiota bacterium]
MKIFLTTLAILTFLPGAANAADKGSAPPNFIIIFTDDLGYGDLGCFGGKIATPRIDQMAREGMRFTSFYAQPICGPSRTALLTGCYPMRVAEANNRKNTHPVLHSKEITIAEVLKTSGYATGCFGKWDQAGHKQRGFNPDLMPNLQGFDYFYGTPSSNDRSVDLYRNEKLIEKETDLSTLTKRYTDEAIDFIGKNQERPFFVYLPHTLLAASKDFRGKSPRGLYGDVINEIDHSTGRILDALQKMGLAESTYVIFTSDNGPWLSKNRGRKDGSRPEDHGGSAGPLRSGKVSTWEGGTRIPAIFWAPGRIDPATTCSSIATTMDLLPTFAALGGVDVPGDRKMDGEDISHLLQGKFDQATRDKTFFGYLTTELQTVRQGSWKLHLPRVAGRKWQKFARNTHIAPLDNITPDKALLFNLDQDLGESKNVAASHPEIVARLLEVANDARADIGDYNQIGSAQRFFDKGPRRPESAKWIKQKQAR